MKRIKNFIRKIPKHVWILAIIVLVGAFLRTYQFHNWLDFGSDQVNDAVRVGNVVQGNSPWPSFGPDMSNSGMGGRENRFRLGPMYYYFEIISAKIFGNKPDSMAYPDLLFSILSIPLFFFFLKKYFKLNIALALTGLYAISYYSLSFSHSAWNVNSIPFFSLLFLLALWEFLIKKEKVSWIWCVVLGISLGVGVQLHAILLVLFPITTICVLFFLIKSDWKIWLKWMVVFFVALILNSGQILSEAKTDFRNSRIFLNSVASSTPDPFQDENEAGNFSKNVSCHMEANAYMLTAIGGDNCTFSLAKIFQDNLNKIEKRRLFKPYSLFGMSLILIFSLFGYGMLAYRLVKEREEKRKYFLGLICLYSVLSFFVLLPVIDSAMRYFVHIIFIPFIFLGLLLEFFSKKIPTKIYMVIISLILFFPIVSNVLAIKNATSPLMAESISDQKRIVLGQIEPMVSFMIANSTGEREVYFMSGTKLDKYYKSLAYLAAQQNISLVRSENLSEVPSGKAVFYLGYNTAGKYKSGEIEGGRIVNKKDFADVTLFELIW